MCAWKSGEKQRAARRLEEAALGKTSIAAAAAAGMGNRIQDEKQGKASFMKTSFLNLNETYLHVETPWTENTQNVILLAEML